MTVTNFSCHLEVIFRRWATSWLKTFRWLGWVPAHSLEGPAAPGWLMGCLLSMHLCNGQGSGTDKIGRGRVTGCHLASPKIPNRQYTNWPQSARLLDCLAWVGLETLGAGEALSNRRQQVQMTVSKCSSCPRVILRGWSLSTPESMQVGEARPQLLRSGDFCCPKPAEAVHTVQIWPDCTG